MSSNPVVQVENLGKIYRIYASPVDRLLQGICGRRKCFFQEFEALKPLSFSVRKGESVGIVGRNGSGKSTLLQLICGTLTQTHGRCHVTGRISALLELGSGFNPDFTGRENVFLNAAILGLSREETGQRYDDIVAFSGIGEKVNQPVKTYSSGMVVRLAFAIAVAVEPDILVVDEALAVGDERFQRKCFARIEEIRGKGATILFVTHSERILMDVCDRALLLDDGELLLDSTPKKVMACYHQLLYGTPEKQQELRESIQCQIDAAQTVQQSEPEAISGADVPSSMYLPELVPESTEIKKSAALEICNAALEDMQGNAVNLLQQGRQYRLVYELHAHERLQYVRTNYRIHNSTGIVICGHNSREADHVLNSLQPGDICRIAFTFECNFCKGDYYITLNVGHALSADSIREPLSRVRDILMFRMHPKAQTQGQHGLVTMHGSVHAEKERKKEGVHA